MKNRAIRFVGVTLLLVSGTTACSGTGSEVRGQGISAEQHRQRAAEQTKQAEAEQAAAAGAPNLSVTPNGNPEGYYLTGAATGLDAHNGRAEVLKRHAQQHLASAAALESFEENECRSVPRDHRASCPLLSPVVKIDDVVGGVRVRFAEGTDVSEVVARMRCHLAFARARGFERVPSCPLYMKGVQIEPSVAQTVEIVSDDANVAGRIRALSREEAILVSGAAE